MDSELFIYEIEENSAVVTGLTAAGLSAAYLDVPDRLSGCAVRKIAPRAFYKSPCLTGVTLPDTVTDIGSYGFAECRKLSHVQMSLSVAVIGDYAFYNCHSLQAVRLPGKLKMMGYGAFKNCSELTEVDLYTDGVSELAAGALFDDTSHEMTVRVCDVNGAVRTKLVLTEFDYDCILQVEARQFDWVYHGSGNIYRQCITKKGIDYEKYDSLFHAAVHEDWPETAMKIALGRVVYPYHLSEKHRNDYEAYLKAHREEVFKYYLKSQNTSEFEKIIDVIASEEAVGTWIDMAGRKNVFGFVSFLMDYKQRHYGRNKKRFVL